MVTKFQWQRNFQLQQKFTLQLRSNGIKSFNGNISSNDNQWQPMATNGNKGSSATKFQWHLSSNGNKSSNGNSVPMAINGNQWQPMSTNGNQLNKK